MQFILEEIEITLCSAFATNKSASEFTHIAVTSNGYIHTIFRKFVSEVEMNTRFLSLYDTRYFLAGQYNKLFPSSMVCSMQFHFKVSVSKDKIVPFWQSIK